MPSVLVTGSSSGIGLATVARFHSAGYDVLATVRRDEDAASLRARFAGIDVLQVDLTDAAAVERVLGATLAERHGVDVVVNNAGASILGVVEELTLEDFRAQMELHLFAVIRITQLALPYMRERGAGRIVQLSSGFGLVALPMFSAYCASKYALEGFSEALAYEVAPFGVFVSLIEPGPVRTRFDANRREASGYRADGAYSALHRAMRARLASSHERRPSTADAVAEVVFRAATEPRPALRYPVGPVGALASVARRLAPERLKRLVIGRLGRG